MTEPTDGLGKADAIYPETLSRHCTAAGWLIPYPWAAHLLAAPLCHLHFGEGRNAQEFHTVLCLNIKLTESQPLQHKEVWRPVKGPLRPHEFNNFIPISEWLYPKGLSKIWRKCPESWQNSKHTELAFILKFLPLSTSRTGGCEWESGCKKPESLAHWAFPNDDALTLALQGFSDGASLKEHSKF